MTQANIIRPKGVIDPLSKPADLRNAEARFSNPDYDLGGELIDDGLVRSRARRGVADEARVNRRTKLKKATAVAGAVLALAGAGQISGANSEVANTIGDKVANLGKEMKNVVTGDPDPLANYTGRDADKNTIAGNSGEDVGEAQSPSVYQGVHLNEGPAITEGPSLPVSPEDREFAEKMAEQNEQAKQQVQEAIDQYNGGAQYQEDNSGGTPARIR